MKNRDIGKLYCLPNKIEYKYFLLKKHKQFLKEAIKFNFS